MKYSNLSKGFFLRNYNLISHIENEVQTMLILKKKINCKKLIQNNE